jgi:hypothetical protein
MAAITTAQAGNWSDTATWTGGVVPGDGDTVTINHDVTIDDSAAATIVIGTGSGTALTIASGKTLQYLSTATVNHVFDIKGDIVVTGTLSIGTLANPIPSTRTFAITPRGNNISGAGTINLYGASKTYWKTTVATAVTAGDKSVVTADATGWAVGDVIIVGASAARNQTEK